MLDFGYVTLNGSKPDLNVLSNASILAFDTETSGVSVASDTPYGYSLASEQTSAYYTNMNNRFFLDLLADEQTLKIAHNAKFDRSMLKKFGVTVNNIYCTMVAAHLLEEERLSLQVLLKRYLKGYDLKMGFFKEFYGPLKHANLQEMANHFGPHSAAALALWNILQKRLRGNMLWGVFRNIEMPVLPVLSDIELNGTLIDVDGLSRLGEYYDEKIRFHKVGLDHFSGHTDINWNSPDQVAAYLYGELKIDPLAKGWWDLFGKWHESVKGDKRPSVDKTVLEGFKGKYPVVNHYLTWKSYMHLKGNYVNGILNRLVEGRIHTNFNQTRTRTGRLSSSDPNLQNIPQRTTEGRKIRQSFIAPEGKKIVKADMDQVELRKMACLSKCKALLDAFREGRDVHGETAIRAYNDILRRPDGKTLNFKLVYGGGTAEEQKILFEAYPEVKAWTDSMGQEFRELGYAKTDYGRTRHLGNFETMSNKEVAHACREGISTMDQGSCSEYLKIGMRKIWNKIKNSDIKMLLQVHDELVFECPTGDIPELVEMIHEDLSYNELEIPLTVSVSIGRNWADTFDIRGKK